MSAPEGLINSLYRASNLQGKDLQAIISSFQAVPKQIDEDVDFELNIYDPEVRNRSESHEINPGGQLLDITRDKSAARDSGYIKSIPSQVYIYPSTHTVNGSVTFPNTSRKYGGQAIFNSGAYTTESNSARFNVTDEISIGGWYRFKQVESGDGFGHIIGKDSQYGLFVLSESFGINKVYSQVTIGSVNKQTSHYEFTPDTWIHLMATWKSPNLKFYVNGSLDNTLATATGALDTTTNMFSIGANHGGFIPVRDTTEYGPQVCIHKEVSAAWVTDHYNGIQDTDNGNDEIVTFPMSEHTNPITDCSVGRCVVN